MRPNLIAVNVLREKEAREARAAEKLIFEKEKTAKILAGYAKSNAERKKRRLAQAENHIALADQAVAVYPNVAAIEEFFRGW